MKLPSRNIGPWAKELIKQCQVSRETRKNLYKFCWAMYYNGSDDGPARDNMCYSHVDKLSSYLFSPADVQFDVSFESDESVTWRGAADIASRYITREFRRNRCGLVFAQAVDVALVCGASLIKLYWDHNGYKSFVIKPERFGVLREDIEDLAEQDAFCYSYFVTPSQFDRMMLGEAERKVDRIREQVVTQASDNADPEFENSYFHEIVAGGTQPIGLNSQTGQRGSVAYGATPTPMLNPEVQAQLIKIDELWVMNDDARDGKGDWNCIRMVGDVVIDGEDYTRNLFIPGEHPFIRVCANEVPGYFWGRPEIITVSTAQMHLNEVMNAVDRIFKMQARPPRSIIGYGGITDEKARILNSPGGMLTDSTPAGTGKIESHAPQMPPDAMAYIALIKANFEEAGGFTPTTSGQAAPGVRSGAQAETLMKTSSPRLRDRALTIEDQCGDFGAKCFALSQAKDGRVFSLPKKGIFGKVNEFLLAQVPQGAQVSVDSHTSSPAFSGANAQLAFALAARGAIDGEGLLRMVKPDNMDSLIDSYRERQEAQQKFMAQHPELAFPHKGGKK